MEEARALRVLQSGGMVVPFEGGGAVYRDQDLRRRAVGVLEKPQLARLLNGALLIQQDGDASRLIWAGEHTDSATRNSTVPLVMPVPQKGKAPARCALEYILRAEDNMKRQAYLVAAAQRFQQDVDALFRGQSVTMNWDFVPRGKARMGRGGMGEVSLTAARVMSQLKAMLGQQDLALLQAILVSDHSVKRILLDYDMSRARFIKVGLRALLRLARAYDRAVTPVSDRF